MTERPEPVPTPLALKAMAKAGRRAWSFSREASRPTMPGCQLSLAVTMIAGPSPPASSASASARASASISCSIACRSWLSRSSVSAIVPASTGSSVASSRLPSAASPMRPPALMRGPIRKPRWKVLIGSPMRDDARQRGEPGILLLADRQQALDDEGAVDAGQRHHVADRGQRHQVEQRKQVGLRRVGPRAAQHPAPSAPASGRRRRRRKDGPARKDRPRGSD